jgi:hypothetical protein
MFPRGATTLPPLPSLQMPLPVIKLDQAKPKRPGPQAPSLKAD